ncbi:SAM-dependent DNA methyltransferase, partial [Mesorhizobium sp. M5C.F.Ca.IN.020.32.2.1]
PGRYVGAKAGEAEDVDFAERLEELQEEFERLTTEARVLEAQIDANLATILVAAE